MLKWRVHFYDAQCLMLIAHCSRVNNQEMSLKWISLAMTSNRILLKSWKGFSQPMTARPKLKKGTQCNRRWHQGSRMNEIVHEMRENEIACTILFDLNVVSVRYCLHEISLRLPNVKKFLWGYLVTSLLTECSCLVLVKL